MRMRRHPSRLPTSALIALAAFGMGCGEGGVSPGATVSVYVAAPLCKEARRELRKAGGAAGDVTVRAICLPSVERNRRAHLSVAGANARRATEDSTSIAYLESRGRGARFTQPILESAEIAWLEVDSAATAIRRILHAAAASGDSSPRDAVRESLSG